MDMSRFHIVREAEDGLHRRQNGCSNLYLYPTASTTLDSATPVTFKWDTSCQIPTPNIDIYVYQSSSENPLINKYSNVPFAPGEYTGKISPSWKGNDTWTMVNIGIVESGIPSWQSTLTTGPTFNVTYTPTVVTVSGSTYTQPPENTGKTTFQSVEDTGGKKSNKGVIAVAVVVPIVVVCILGAIAFYIYRVKEKKKLRRWSQALSQHSQLEWEKGALPGERISSSYGRPSSGYSRSGSGRPSTGYGRPSTGYGRPSTGYGRPSMSSMNRPTSSVMENMAGAGAVGLRQFPGAGDMDPNRSSIVMPDGQVRQSRISFADTARPRISSENRLRVGSGYHSSVDELRNMEAVQFVTHPGDSIEDISPVSPTSPTSGSGSGGSGAGGHSTVQYGPDQMLAVYAQRKGSTSPTPPAPAMTTAGSKVKRFLSRKNKAASPPQMVQDIRVTAPSPEPVPMVSYVHLNNGTAAASAVGNLPPPGPPRPDSAQSAVSRYEDAREHQ